MNCKYHPKSVPASTLYPPPVTAWDRLTSIRYSICKSKASVKDRHFGYFNLSLYTLQAMYFRDKGKYLNFLLPFPLTFQHKHLR